MTSLIQNQSKNRPNIFFCSVAKYLIKILATFSARLKNGKTDLTKFWRIFFPLQYCVTIVYKKIRASTFMTIGEMDLASFNMGHYIHQQNPQTCFRRLAFNLIDCLCHLAKILIDLGDDLVN